MNFKEKLSNLSENYKMFILLAIFAFAGALIFIPFCATGLLQWGWEFGFLFGSAIEAISLLLLILSTNLLTKASSSMKATLLSVLFFMLRFVLYAGGLVLAAFFQYKWNMEYVFNLFGVFIAYLPMQIVVIIVMLRNKDKTKIINEGETK